MARTGAIRIGISGWTYAPWRGKFYPKGLVRKRELFHASRIFRSIEINGTFYGQQTPESFAHWAAEVPEDFVFAVKAPRFITHVRRLKDAKAPLANFIASGVLRLGAKLGPILWQLPPNFRFDPARLEPFLALLPQDTDEAKRLARSHDDRLRSPPWTRVERQAPLRHAIEVRNDSFVAAEFIDMLRAYRVALVCADTVDWPRLMDVTADFVYCRLHGSRKLYVSGYSEKALRDWADRVTAWARGGEPQGTERAVDRPAPKRKARDVFVYFDNDMKVRAPANALRLEELVASRLAG